MNDFLNNENMTQTERLYRATDKEYQIQCVGYMYGKQRKQAEQTYGISFIDAVAKWEQLKDEQWTSKRMGTQETAFVTRHSDLMMQGLCECRSEYLFRQCPDGTLMIDWTDSALIYKGFSWMAKHYLMRAFIDNTVSTVESLNTGPIFII